MLTFLVGWLHTSSFFVRLDHVSAIFSAPFTSRRILLASERTIFVQSLGLSLARRIHLINNTHEITADWRLDATICGNSSIWATPHSTGR